MLRSLGPYDLEGEIGRGAMGVVYRARHRPTGALRALKVLEGAPDPEALERFRREAQALARADGPGVVKVHETFVEGRRLAFAMGLLTGGSLAARLRRGRLPWREAVALVLELARALERCHGAGLIHRDLKPENVLFDERGAPFLADFGCVRDLGGTTLSQTGTVLGTPGYMAPEQLDGQKVDARADLYALGVILYELVTGERPYAGRTYRELLLASMAGRYVPASDLLGRSKPLANDLPPRAFDAVIARTLAPDPARRFSSAAELVSDLDALLAGKKVAARPSRAPRLLGVAAVVVLLGVAALALVMPSRNVASPPASSPRPESVAPPSTATAPPVKPHLDRAEADKRARVLADHARRELYAKGKTDQALVEVNQALDLSPDLPVVLALLADVLLAQGKIDEATPIARRVHQLDPSAVPADMRALDDPVERLRSHLQDKRTADSTYFETRMREGTWRLGADPDAPELWANRAYERLMGRRGYMDPGTEGDARRTLALDPTSSRGWAVIAWLQFHRGEPLDAIASATSALWASAREVSPIDEGWAHEAVAFSRASRDDVEGALAEQQAALAIAERRAGLGKKAPAGDYATRAAFEARLGRLEEARADMKLARELDPSLAGSQWQLSEVLAAEHDFDGAIRTIEAVERELPDPFHLRIRAHFILERGRSDDLAGLRETLVRAIEAHPKLAALWLTLGRVDERLGHPDETDLDDSHALEVDPALTAAWIARGELRRRLGKASARADLERALELARSPDERTRLTKSLAELGPR